MLFDTVFFRFNGVLCFRRSVVPPGTQNAARGQKTRYAGVMVTFEITASKCSANSCSAHNSTVTEFKRFARFTLRPLSSVKM